MWRCFNWCMAGIDAMCKIELFRLVVWCKECHWIHFYLDSLCTDNLLWFGARLHCLVLQVYLAYLQQTTSHTGISIRLCKIMPCASAYTSQRGKNLILRGGLECTSLSCQSASRILHRLLRNNNIAHSVGHYWKRTGGNQCMR